MDLGTSLVIGLWALVIRFPAPAIFLRASGSLWADQSGLMAEPNTGFNGEPPSRRLVSSSRNPGSGFRNEKVNTGGGEGS